MVKKYGYKIWVYINCAGRKVVFECGSYVSSWICAEATGPPPTPS